MSLTRLLFGVDRLRDENVHVRCSRCIELERKLSEDEQGNAEAMALVLSHEGHIAKLESKLSEAEARLAKVVEAATHHCRTDVASKDHSDCFWTLPYEVLGDAAQPKEEMSEHLDETLERKLSEAEAEVARLKAERDEWVDALAAKANDLAERTRLAVEYQLRTERAEARIAALIEAGDALVRFISEAGEDSYTAAERKAWERAKVGK